MAQVPPREKPYWIGIYETNLEDAFNPQEAFEKEPLNSGKFIQIHLKQSVKPRSPCLREYLPTLSSVEEETTESLEKEESKEEEEKKEEEKKEEEKKSLYEDDDDWCCLMWFSLCSFPCIWCNMY